MQEVSIALVVILCCLAPLLALNSQTKLRASRRQVAVLGSVGLAVAVVVLTAYLHA